MKALIILTFVALAAASPTDRIVDGTDATTMVPWQASLQRMGSHFCGGSVISDTFIMTACHCKLDNVTDITVHLGSMELNSPDQVIPMKTFTCHPNWMRLLIDYDYGIIEMETPAMLNDRVQVIALPFKDIEYPAYTEAYISGWGLLHGNDNELPNHLQWAKTQLLPSEGCFSILGKRLTPRMQCVGGMGNTACSGDSGGPLVIQESDGTWILVGNTSYGIAKCPIQTNAVWSKNSVVIDWISSITSIPPR